MDESGFSVKFLRSYGKGETIFEEGSAGRHMYVINAGRVDIVRRADGGDALVGQLGPGEIFGEMALVDSLPRSASAVASEDGTSLVEIDHSQFVYLVGQQPAFALIILKALSLRLRSRMVGENGAAGHEKGVPQ